MPDHAHGRLPAEPCVPSASSSPVSLHPFVPFQPVSSIPSASPPSLPSPLTSPPSLLTPGQEDPTLPQGQDPAAPASLGAHFGASHPCRVRSPPCRVCSPLARRSCAVISLPFLLALPSSAVISPAPAPACIKHAHKQHRWLPAHIWRRGMEIAAGSWHPPAEGTQEEVGGKPSH